MVANYPGSVQMELGFFCLEDAMERPILFNSDMVRAILDGRKTQTRRIVKNLPDNYPDGMRCTDPVYFDDHGWYLPTNKGYKKFYCNRGDQLWVRETHNIQQIKNGWRVGYYADDSVLEFTMPYVQWHDVADKLQNGLNKKRPSIHMPRWASRIALEITTVRVERLQDINDVEILAEGIPQNGRMYDPSGITYSEGLRNDFRHLWDSINAKRGYSWDSNPWVWVIEFELLD